MILKRGSLGETEIGQLNIIITEKGVHSKFYEKGVDIVVVCQMQDLDSNEPSVNFQIGFDHY